MNEEYAIDSKNAQRPAGSLNAKEGGLDSSPRSPAVHEESALTKERTEEKFLVSPAQSHALVSRLDEHLARHHFRGPGHTELPGAKFHTTTVYFDNADRGIFRAAQDKENHLKLRAREYYSWHPSLTQLATSPHQLVRYSNVLWLELKQRVASVVKKRRVGIPKPEVPDFFGSGLISDRMIELQRPILGNNARAVLEEVIDLCAVYPGLRADVLVNYQRIAWEGDAIRITLDRDVSFFAPPPDLWQRQRALTKQSLPKPLSCLDNWILEVKLGQGHAAWPHALAAELGLQRQTISKFVTASRAHHE